MAADEPIVVLLEAKHADEPHQRAVVGGDADHVGASADLLVEALEWVGRPAGPRAWSRPRTRRPCWTTPSSAWSLRRRGFRTRGPPFNRPTWTSFRPACEIGRERPGFLPTQLNRSMRATGWHDTRRAARPVCGSEDPVACHRTLPTRTTILTGVPPPRERARMRRSEPPRPVSKATNGSTQRWERSLSAAVEDAIRRVGAADGDQAGPTEVCLIVQAAVDEVQRACGRSGLRKSWPCADSHGARAETAAFGPPHESRDEG